ncbi:hypothetical protein FS837_012564 [Tulasnella sp. UAMH 9824]|nr:hypothetical protein FS837_012564 [Tulasnella sp. UAMH 9824]
MARQRSQGKGKGKVSFNPIVHEKRLENGLSDDDEVEEVEEVEEEQVAKELEMESASADEIDEGGTPTLTPQEARSLSGQFKQMKPAQDTGFKKGDIRIKDAELLWKARVVRAKKDKAGQATRLDVHQLTDDPEQEEINEGAWYTRASYNLNTKKFKVSTAPCSLCHNYYRPESGEEKDEQAYCPNCHKWYHHGCLIKEEQQVFQDDHEQDLTKLLAANLAEPPSEPPVKRTRRDTGPNSKASPTRRGPPGAEHRAQKILRTIAGTRIVRGGSFGITGIVKQICIARRILSELESGVISGLMSTDWDKEIGVQLVKAAKRWPDSTAFCYTCPTCEAAI